MTRILLGGDQYFSLSLFHLAAWLVMSVRCVSLCAQWGRVGVFLSSDEEKQKKITIQL